MLPPFLTRCQLKLTIVVTAIRGNCHSYSRESSPTYLITTPPPPPPHPHPPGEYYRMTEWVWLHIPIWRGGEAEQLNWIAHIVSISRTDTMQHYTPTTLKQSWY